MNPNTQFERDLEQWLRTEAPASAPAGFHATVMDRARTLRQRPGWVTSLPVRRFGRGRGMTLLAAAALLLVGGALAAGSGILRLPSIVLPVPEPSPDATIPSPSESATPSASPIPVAGPGGVWIPTGSMVTPRSGHDAVRLLDGRVLVVGGTENSSGPEPTSAEIYDPASGTWSATGSMLNAQYGFPPTLLLDGRVLVGDSDDPAADVVTFGSEVYDPESGTWSSSGTVFTGNGADGFTATLLRDGKVLMYGPTGGHLYDPDSGTWSATGTMITPRHFHTATLLPDGRVLVAGGSCDVLACGYSPPGEAELYDPVTGSWTAIANSTTKGDLWAGLLRDGTLLLMSDSANLYDPTSGTWSTLAAPPEPGNPVALLPDDTVLLAVEGPPPSCTAATLYDPRTGSAANASTMLRCVSAVGQPPLFTLLLDGTVLVAGGSVCSNDGDGECVATGAAELYVPAGVSPPLLPAFPSPPLPVFPSPTPRATPLPPAVGPVPPNARSWTVTVDNKSSEPATLFVAEEDEHGISRLVGSATPNVVPAGAAVKVTFLFPPDGGWIYVNPRPGEGGALVNADQIGIPGKILITADGQVGWLSP
jgi:hypothetical protein